MHTVLLSPFPSAEEHGLVFLPPSVMDEISVELPSSCLQKNQCRGQFEEGAKQITTLPYGFHKISCPGLTYSGMDTCLQTG